MAKRKRGKRKGFKLNLPTDYRTERFVPYIMPAEAGILQAGTLNPDLTDGQVEEALKDLIKRLQKPGALEQLLPAEADDEAEAPAADPQAPEGFVQFFILMNLRRAFDQEGPLPTEDVIGILEVIKSSVKTWGVGAHRRGYLTYLEGFLGQAGLEMQRLTAEEAAELSLLDPGLEKAEPGADDDEKR